MPASFHRFEMLDGIRGLAALVIAQRHISYFFFETQLPGGYLAADVFFLLSGFVLAYAYEAKMASGLGTLAFLRARLIRIYPLYLLALVFSVALLFVQGSSEPALEWPPGTLNPLLITLGLFMVPTIGIAAGVAQENYPLNYPSWTLPLELLANLAHVLVVRRLSTRMLTLCVVGFGVLLVATAFDVGNLDTGRSASQLLMGTTRVGFSYFLGVLLFRHWRARGTSVRVSAWVILVGVLMVMLMPILPAWRALYDCVAVIFILPTLIYVAASVEMGRHTRKFLLPLGAASYALYVLHVPFGFFSKVMVEGMGHDVSVWAPWVGIAVMLSLLFLCIMLDRYFDRPVRQHLTRRFTGFTRS